MMAFVSSLGLEAAFSLSSGFLRRYGNMVHVETFASVPGMQAINVRPVNRLNHLLSVLVELRQTPHTAFAERRGERMGWAAPI